MISDSQLPELASYGRIERDLPIKDSPDYGPLVIANGNELRPVHRWFRFKEGFSADLLRHIIASHPPRTRQLRILDPFCGAGTAILSAQMLSSKSVQVSAVGIERNPFIGFVAQTKLLWPEIDPSEMESLGSRILEETPPSRSAIPSLSSLTTGRCVSRHIASRLLALRDLLNESGSSPLQAVLMLGLASAIEPLSRVRKDGRALRLIERPRRVVSSMVASKWRDIGIDIVFMQEAVERPGKAVVIVGDGRVPREAGIPDGSVDLVVTSPPYPNNIDYSEVYKLELWLLGFVTSSQQFLQLRKETFRSHPTSDLATVSDDFLDEVKRGKLRSALRPLLERTEIHREGWRQRLVLGYFSDLWISMREQFRSLRKGGRAFVVLGNSLHGASDAPYLVPTDIIAGIIGRCAGFELDKILVARPLKRRLSGNHFLRDSVVVLRKCDG